MPQLPISDEYFNRSAAIVADTPYYNKRVRYCVFSRKSGVVCGINRAVTFIDEQCLGPLKVTALRDGDRFEPCEAVMVIEGLFGELVNLETTYLGMLAFSGAATEMAEIVAAADGLPVIDMAARHYPFEIIEQTAYAAAIGGAVGTSTRAGHRYVHEWLGTGNGAEQIAIGDGKPREFKLYGSIPHCLNAIYAGSSIDAAKAYHAKYPEIPLTVLIDFEGRELDVCREAAKTFGEKLHAVRIDTHGGRVHQGGHAETNIGVADRIMSNVQDQRAAREAISKFGFGVGVTIEAAFNVRAALDEAGAKHTKIHVTSGFTAEKTRAFRVCNAPIDGVGSGSWVDFFVFTSDITAVSENGGWSPRTKAERGGEIRMPDLPVRIDRLD